ncbi:DMT family transporter [Desulfocurvus sp.]|uniref:DMT family transporter n=1 Tax=Desulfocurvus sp. TaxID=2871698 RepID=UPI0025C2F28F|nr:DMT family transporter [Desulfocurvus sp.]MCK9240861.1 DMT family transporter [Desulfocurvus sp.]
MPRRPPAAPEPGLPDAPRPVPAPAPSAATANAGPPLGACLCLALAMAIVGSSVVAGKLLVAELPVQLASALRFACAALVLVPLLLLREGWPRVSARSLAVMLAQAACGGLLFNVLLLQGLRATSAGAAGIITSTTPAAMACTAFVLLGERPARRTLAGVALSVAGLAAVNLQGMAQNAGGAALGGNLLVLGAVLAESLFLLLRKAVPEPLSPLAVSTLMTVFGLGLFAPGALAQARGFDFAALDATSWAVVAYYGLVVTVAAYLLWFRGVTRVGAGTAGVFTAVMPVSAVGLSALVLGEAPGPGHLAGAGLVLAGIWCICRRG